MRAEPDVMMNVRIVRRAEWVWSGSMETDGSSFSTDFVRNTETQVTTHEAGGVIVKRKYEGATWWLECRGSLLAIDVRT